MHAAGSGEALNVVAIVIDSPSLVFGESLRRLSIWWSFDGLHRQVGSAPSFRGRLSGMLSCAMFKDSSWGWPLRSTMTVTRSDAPIVLKISMPRCGSSSGVPLIESTRSPGCRPELRELLAITTRIDAIAALDAVRKHRLRTNDFRERGRIGFCHAAQVLGEPDWSSERGGGVQIERRFALTRQEQRLQFAVRVQDDACPA